jgi:hypothetical protein
LVMAFPERKRRVFFKPARIRKQPLSINVFYNRHILETILEPAISIPLTIR